MKRWMMLVFWLGSLVSATAWEQNVHGDRSRVLFKFTSMFDALPQQGFMPIRMHVMNRGLTEARYDVRFSSGSSWQNDPNVTRMNSSVRVPAGEERIVEVMVPIQPMDNHRNNVLRVSVNGPGISVSDMHLFSGSSWRHADQVFALSQSLAGRNRSELQMLISGGRGGDAVATMSLIDLTEDVRALSGMDVIILNTQEWNELEQAGRYLFQQWVGRGGMLVLASEGNSLRPRGIPGFEPGGLPDAVPLGWGVITGHSLSGGLINAAGLRAQVSAGSPGAGVDLRRSFVGRSWALQAQVRELNTPLGLLFVVVLVVAVLLGPVNVITAFRRKKVVRLLWVTPLASVALSLILMGVIVLVDGFGGTGERSLTVFLAPEAGLEVLTQEQISRTGVLLRRQFTLPQGAVMFPAILHPNQRVSGRHRLEGDRWDGDWFRSRNLQAQVLQHSRPSRSRIEVAPGPEGPSVFSTLDDHLTLLYLRDGEGRYWKAENLHAGQRQTLQATTQQEARLFVDSLRLRPNEAVVPVRGNGTFVAVSAPRKDGFLETLPSIRWGARSIRYTGMIVERSAP